MLRWNQCTYNLGKKKQTNHFFNQKCQSFVTGAEISEVKWVNNTQVLYNKVHLNNGANQEMA